MIKNQHFTHFFFLFLFHILQIVFCYFFLGFSALHQPQYHLPFDTYSYLDALKLLINEHCAHPTRCIGYPLFLFFPYHFFHISTTFFITVFVLQNALLLWAYTRIYKVIQYYKGNKVALVSTLICMSNISYISFSFHVLTETVCTFLLIYFIYNMHNYIVLKKNKNILWAILSLSVAVLFKPGLLYLYLLIVLAFSIYFLYKKQSKIPIYFLIITISSIGVQSIMMYKKYNTFKITYIDQITQYRYFNTSINGLLQHKEKLQLMHERDSIMSQVVKDFSINEQFKKYSTVTKEESKLLWRNHPLICVQAYFENLFSNFHTGNAMIRDMDNGQIYSPILKKKIYDYTRIWNMLHILLLAFLNIFLIYQFFFDKKSFYTKPQFIFVTLCVFLCNYIFILSGISFFQGDRFNVVWMPICLVALIICFSHLCSKYVTISKKP